MKYIIVSSLAILVIGGLEAIALLNGIDGVALSGSIAVIGGIAGFNVHRLREKNIERGK